MFGPWLGALCMTRVNQLKRFVLAKPNHNVLLYIDDAIGAGTLSQTKEAFQFLLVLLQKLGLPISALKLEHPSTGV